MRQSRLSLQNLFDDFTPFLSLDQIERGGGGGGKELVEKPSIFLFSLFFSFFLTAIGAGLF